MTSSAPQGPSSPKKSGLSHLADRLDNARDRWRDDPAGWVEHRLAGVLWSRQKEIAELLVHHKRVGVRSCHSSGKTWLAAALAAWWVDVHPPGQALVVSTAPSFSQVGVLWEELRKIHAAAGLPGTILGSNHWKLDDGTLVGIGRRPVDQGNWQGYHRPHVLAIMDEAAAIPAWVFTSMETITTGPGCRILAITNPDDPTSAMAKTLTDDTWKSLKIDAFSTPDFTGEKVPPFLLDGRLIDRKWVDEKRIQWGEDNPLWRAKIEAEFVDSADGLIPLSWITAAQTRWREWQANPTEGQTHGPRVFGVDPAGPGRDRTAICTRKGAIIESIETFQGLDTTEIAGMVEAKLRGTLQGRAVVDVVGLGLGVGDQLRRAGCNVYLFNGSRGTKFTDATGEWHFPNLRSASYFNLRQLLDPHMDGKLCLPPDDDLAAELASPKFEYRAGGSIVVESKDATKARIGHSPDKADSLAYACWRDIGPASRDYDPEHGYPQLQPIAYRAAEEITGQWGGTVFTASDFGLTPDCTPTTAPDDIPWPDTSLGQRVSYREQQGPW